MTGALLVQLRFLVDSHRGASLVERWINCPYNNWNWVWNNLLCGSLYPIAVWWIGGRTVSRNKRSEQRLRQLEQLYRYSLRLAVFGVSIFYGGISYFCYFSNIPYDLINIIGFFYCVLLRNIKTKIFKPPYFLVKKLLTFSNDGQDIKNVKTAGKFKSFDYLSWVDDTPKMGYFIGFVAFLIVICVLACLYCCLFHRVSFLWFFYSNLVCSF